MAKDHSHDYKHMSLRPYAAFWEWPEKTVKESGVLRSYLEARERLGLPEYFSSVQPVKPDPPDFVAITERNKRIGIELTELVCEAAIKANLMAKNVQDLVYRDWTTREVVSAIQERLDEKDRKVYNGGAYDEIHVIIHTDEPTLRLHACKPDLDAVSFRPCRQIGRAYLLLAYDPDELCCPVLELRLG